MIWFEDYGMWVECMGRDVKGKVGHLEKTIWVDCCKTIKKKFIVRSLKTIVNKLCFIILICQGMNKKYKKKY